MLTRAFLRSALAAPFVMAAALPAASHVGHGETDGLLHGFLHPIGGLDHMLAMLAVGLLAALLGGRALWTVPLSFLAMMSVGWVLAMGGTSLPFVEFGISLSVIALGLAVALKLPLPAVVAVALAGFFAVFHGHAHGAEMPVDASGVRYAAGFLAATSLLHAAGIALGIVFGRLASMSDLIPRLAGGAIAIAGIVLATPI